MSALGIDKSWSVLSKGDRPDYHPILRKGSATPPWETRRNHPVVPLIRSDSQLTEIEHDGLQQFWIAENRSRSNSIVSSQAYHYSPRQQFANGWETPSNQSCHSSQPERVPHRPASATGHYTSRVYIPPGPKSNPEKPSFVVSPEPFFSTRKASLASSDMSSTDWTRGNAPADGPRHGMPLRGATMSSRQTEQRPGVHSNYGGSVPSESAEAGTSYQQKMYRQHSSGGAGSQTVLPVSGDSMSQSSSPRYDRQSSFLEQRKASLGGFSAGPSPGPSPSHPPFSAHGTSPASSPSYPPLTGQSDYQPSPALTREFEQHPDLIPRPQDLYNPDTQPKQPAIGQKPKELEDLAPDDSWRRKASVESSKEKPESSRLGSKLKQHLKGMFKPIKSRSRDEEQMADSPSDTHKAFE